MRAGKGGHKGHHHHSFYNHPKRSHDYVKTEFLPGAEPQPAPTMSVRMVEKGKGKGSRSGGYGTPGGSSRSGGKGKGERRDSQGTPSGGAPSGAF